MIKTVELYIKSNLRENERVAFKLDGDGLSIHTADMLLGEYRSSSALIELAQAKELVAELTKILDQVEAA
jgi:hypothetical protein